MRWMVQYSTGSSVAGHGGGRCGGVARVAAYRVGVGFLN